MESVRSIFKLNNSEYQNVQYGQCDGTICELYSIPNLVGNECSVIGDPVLLNYV